MRIRGSFRPSTALVFGAFVISTVLAAVHASATAGPDEGLVATWLTQPVSVDGSLLEWPDLHRVGTGPMVGARNDADALYLAIASNDVTVRQQIATGVIVWFDRAGGKGQTFGLWLEGVSPRPLAGATPDPSSNGLDRIAQNQLDQVDVLGPAKNQRRLIDRPGDIGLALASGIEDRSVVYEMKVPLARTTATPQAVDAKPGAIIGIGIETPADPKPPKRRDGLENPMSTNPWVINPYGGYFNPPPTNSADREKPAVFKPLKLLWTTVRLATKP